MSETLLRHPSARIGFSASQQYQTTVDCAVSAVPPHLRNGKCCAPGPVLCPRPGAREKLCAASAVPPPRRLYPLSIPHPSSPSWLGWNTQIWRFHAFGGGSRTLPAFLMGRSGIFRLSDLRLCSSSICEHESAARRNRAKSLVSHGDARAESRPNAPSVGLSFGKR